MTSYQIDTVLNLSLSKIHGGVYPADRLPEIPNTFDRPKAFVANTDNHDFPGQHWVAFYFPSKGPSEYFDSYGLPPWKSQFLDFLEAHYVINPKVLQSSISELCGQYCIMYLMLRAKDFSQTAILSIFSQDTLQNDKIVETFYNSLQISLPLPQAKQSTPTCQICLSRKAVEIPLEQTLTKYSKSGICF